MTRYDEAYATWKAAFAALQAAHAARSAAINAARAEYRAKVREANLAFEAVNAKAKHAHRECWLVAHEAQTPGLRAVLAGVLTDEELLRKAGLLRADGELTRWGRVLREHVQEGASASSREPAAPTGAG
jgi:hypothetical protein